MTLSVSARLYEATRTCTICVRSGGHRSS